MGRKEKERERLQLKIIFTKEKCVECEGVTNTDRVRVTKFLVRKYK